MMIPKSMEVVAALQRVEKVRETCTHTQAIAALSGTFTATKKFMAAQLIIGPVRADTHTPRLGVPL